MEGETAPSIEDAVLISSARRALPLGGAFKGEREKNRQTFMSKIKKKLRMKLWKHRQRETKKNRQRLTKKII